MNKYRDEFYVNKYSVPAFTGDFPSENIRRDYMNLTRAVRSGNKVLVQQLINNGAPVNRSFDLLTLTPLHLAVQSRSSEIVQILLNEGADVNAKSWNGATPLILAARTGDSLLIDILLSSSDLQNQEDEDHLSHLHVACMRNKVEIVKKLLSLNQGNNLNKSVKKRAAFWRGYAPLHFSSHFGCAETTEYLLKCGADILAINSDGLTPLHLADLQRNGKIIDILLSAHKCEIRNPKSPQGMTHFHIACTRDETSFVEHFLNAGVNIDLLVVESDADQGPWSLWKPIDFAMYYGCSTVIQSLKRAGACLDGASNILVKYEYMMENDSLYELLITNKIESDKTRNGKNYDLISVFENLRERNALLIGRMYQALSDFIDSAPHGLGEPTLGGDTLLHLVVKLESTKAITYLMSRRVDFMVQNVKGETPFHVAFRNGATEILDMIIWGLSSEAKNLTDDDGLSLFHILSTTNRLEEIQNFLHAGVDINAQVSDESEFWAGFTALHFACKYRQVDVVKLLLENHADVHITNKIYLDPYNSVVEEMVSDHCFEHESHFKILGTFLETLDSKIESINTSGMSLLHALCFDGKSEPEDLNLLRQCLLKNQNEINQRLELNCKHFYNKCTPLHLAMKFGNWEKAQLLLENGANPLAVNSNGRTPLECAFHGKSSMDDLTEFALIFFTSETVNQTVKSSHFHMACATGQLDVVTRVLEISDKERKKTFVNSCDDVGRTPLHWLLQKSDTDKPRRQIAHLLLENGANANARDYKLQTPLHFAYRFGDVDVVKLLIDHGAELDPLDINGCILLSNFIRNHSAEEILTLLDCGVDINLMGSDGLTCLVRMYHCFSCGTTEDSENKSKGPDCMIIMLKHIKKLELIDWHVSEKNRLDYANALTHVKKILNEASFISECERELQLMETLNIDRYTTLRDVLSKNLNQMAFHYENANLRQLVESDDYNQRFPIYGPLVKLQMKNGAIRRSLLIETEKSLTALIQVHLPQICLEMIFWDMCETDLRNIILSTKK